MFAKLTVLAGMAVNIGTVAFRARAKRSLADA
jgi:hypothetical protein